MNKPSNPNLSPKMIWLLTAFVDGNDAHWMRAREIRK